MWLFMAGLVMVTGGILWLMNLLRVQGQMDLSVCMPGVYEQLALPLPSEAPVRQRRRKKKGNQGSGFRSTDREGMIPLSQGVGKAA